MLSSEYRVVYCGRRDGYYASRPVTAVGVVLRCEKLGTHYLQFSWQTLQWSAIVRSEGRAPTVPEDFFYFICNLFVFPR